MTQACKAEAPANIGVFTAEMLVENYEYTGITFAPTVEKNTTIPQGFFFERSRFNRVRVMLDVGMKANHSTRNGNNTKWKNKRRESRDARTSTTTTTTTARRQRS